MAEAYVTLLYDDGYLPGLLVLGHRLRDLGTRRSLVTIVTGSVGEHSKALLREVYDEVIPVATITNKSSVGFSLLNRPELDRSYTKIHVWSLLQYSKVIFLDADILVVKPIDDLFGWDVPRGSIAAAPDIGWPDIFNSGVFVAVPDAEAYEELCGRAVTGESFDGGDQGLLNQYFTERGRWVRLPFTFNVTPSTSYQYAPAFQHFERQVSVVHFIGNNKPWDNAFHRHFHSKLTESGSMDYVSKWWDVAYEHSDTKEMLQPPHAPHPATMAPADGAADQDTGRQPGGSVYDAAHAAHAAVSAPTDARDDNLRFDPFGGYRDKQVDTIIRPDVRRWDPTRMPPPIASKPEAENLHFARYENIWDRPPSPPSQAPETPPAPVPPAEHHPHHHRRHSAERKHERRPSREPAHRTQKPLKPVLKHTNYNPPSDLDDKTSINLEIERKEHIDRFAAAIAPRALPRDEADLTQAHQAEYELAITMADAPQDSSEGEGNADSEKGEVKAEKDTGEIKAEEETGEIKAEEETGEVMEETREGSVEKQQEKKEGKEEKEKTGSSSVDEPSTPQFRFPILGPTVFKFPWETKDRPKPERVFPELELPDAAAKLPPPPPIAKPAGEEEKEEKEEEEEEEESTSADLKIGTELLEKLEIAKQQVQDEEIWSEEAEKDKLVATEEEIFAGNSDSVDPHSPAPAASATEEAAVPSRTVIRPKNAWDMIPNIDEYARFAAREYEYEDSDEEADTSVTPKPQKRNHFRGLSVSEEFKPQWRSKNTPETKKRE
ncbi:hypothetical protein TRVA0_025S01046 [Trichomonascus vanleenenianus]|uniref:glycosyltransferase family 8 protein n=1 Tax=Trichomonascus vanleenenianus TaxID=2268995 RepID=UPI003EC9C017